MTKKLEYFRGRALEVKMTDGEAGEIEGYGSVYGVEDKGGDIVAPLAFKTSIESGRMPKMLWQHDPNTPIGVWDEVKEDGRGLVVKGRLNLDTTAGRDALGNLRMKSVDGLSIGYMTKDADFDSKTGIRTIKEADLWEVSVVTFPMNELAGVHSVKSQDEIDAMTLPEIERHMREAWDAPRTEAKRVLHRLSALIEQRKADEVKATLAGAELKALIARLKA